MTYEEIIQALRQCTKRDCSSCGMCPIFPDRECVEHLAAAAASLIERLTAENAALREKQRWIPVAERPPEKQAWYHVAIRDKKNNEGFRRARFIRRGNSKEFWSRNRFLQGEQVARTGRTYCVDAVSGRTGRRQA